MSLRKIGAEVILGFISLTLIPFCVWIIGSIYDLRADYSDIRYIKEKVEKIEKGQDKIVDYLIQGKRK